MTQKIWKKEKIINKLTLLLFLIIPENLSNEFNLISEQKLIFEKVNKAFDTFSNDKIIKKSKDLDKVLKKLKIT